MSTALARPPITTTIRQRGPALWFLIGLVVGALVALVASWILARNFILHDDSERGARYRDTVIDTQPSASRSPRTSTTKCQLAAEAFYGHDILGGNYDATPEEKAFFVGCSGMSVGGQGGGRSGGGD